MFEEIRLIPYPRKVGRINGYKDCTSIRISGQRRVNGMDVGEFLGIYGVNTGQDGVNVSCETGLDDCGTEGYKLSISDEGVKLRAGTDAGLIYALVTLAQLIGNYGGKIPVCEIEDSPSTAYRGFMLDAGRYFFPKEDVIKLVDLCVLHKINAFHWHLTEDQGWRLESEKYPLLTEKGSRRSHTNFGIRPHGGFYTKKDIAEVVEYCRKRNVSVIPEFDVPGHSVAALSCYPWLGCFDRKLKVATHSGVKHDVMCAGKESTYTFVTDVLDEIVGLFGGNTAYIHIGGDEAVKTRWKICPHCQAKMKELGLKSEGELQAYFMSRVADHVVGKGFTPVMWNETDLSLPCHEKAVWQIWTTGGALSVADIARFAAKHGGVINSDSNYAYLDMPYAYVNLEKCYSFTPMPDGIEPGGFVGAEAALWTEYVPNFKSACRKSLPRLCALSDAMWGRYGGDFSGFCARLDFFEKYLAQLGYKGSGRAQTMPGKARAFFQKIVFERRQLHWQGLHNLIDNAAVKRKYGKEKR